MTMRAVGSSSKSALVPSRALLGKPRATAPTVSGSAGMFHVQELWARLRKEVEGETRFDDGTRGLYAQDASNYLHVPIGVVLPRSVEDVIATLKACEAFGAPVVSRGGGTGLAGQTANEAVVIDFSKYMNSILELDPVGRRARVEPGVICDTLAHAAQEHGLTWGPQPATHSHCCFGGMLANNCGGMRAQQAGIAVHHVEEMDIALYDGTRLTVGWMNDAELEERSRASGQEGRIFTALKHFREKYAERIAAGFPVLPRRVSGYNLDELLNDEEGRFNVARALVGSEGTCVTMLSATIRLVDFYPERAVVAMGYDNVYDAGDHVLDALEFNPTAVEGMDRLLYEHVTKKHMPEERFLNVLPRGNGWLLVELSSHDREEALARAEALLARVQRSPRPPVEARVVDNRDEQEHLWKVRESGLGATAFVPGEPDTWPGFEDSAVRPEQVGDYLRDLRALFDKFDYRPSLYGHFGMGCIHCRIPFELTSAPGIAKYRAFMEEAADLVAVKYRGSISGEHGDGQARGELLEKMFGRELVEAFREYKAIWDPAGKMNPGRIVDTPPFDTHLRLGADYRPWRPETHFKFPDDDGSFAHATLRCVGVGKCRRLAGEGDHDTMCPSFMVTREERHSTRGRTHLLWEMMRGKDTPIKDRWRDENVKEALDLCLSCKGCKGDCPVNVDVATYKAEFLSHYYEGRIRPRHAYAFGLINQWARLGSLVPGLVNLATQTPGLASVAKFLAGISQRRSVPAFAPETFRSWFARREKTDRPEGQPKVLLFPDTFNSHFYPDTARAAVEVLEHVGFEVVIPARLLCCGRPLYDYGMLELAREYLEEILEVLEPHIVAGTPMVVLEPSCCAVFRDELTALLPKREHAKRLAQQTMLLSEFLMKHAAEKIPSLARKAIVQGHCHHKAVMHFDDEKKVFERMGLNAELLESGCCGMAGSFGFEADKFEVSQACGERVLLPRVRAESDDTLIVADGFSCRTQIAQNTERQALHLAEVLQLALDRGPAGTPPGVRPEQSRVDDRREGVRRSMHKAAIATSAVVVVVMGATIELLHAAFHVF